MSSERFDCDVGLGAVLSLLGFCAVSPKPQSTYFIKLQVYLQDFKFHDMKEGVSDVGIEWVCRTLSVPAVEVGCKRNRPIDLLSKSGIVHTLAIPAVNITRCPQWDVGLPDSQIFIDTPVPAACDKPLPRFCILGL